MTNANPNINPADTGTLLGTLQSVMRNMMQNTDGMMPAKVIGYTPGPPAKVQVQPLIKIVATDGMSTSRSQIAEVPVLTLGGGGFVLSMPLKPGDTGWLFACDRDISLYVQAAGQQQTEETEPNTNRIKSFSDSIFIPDILHSYTIDGADLDSLVLQSIDGETKIVLAENLITIKAQNVVIDSETTTITGALEIQGGLACSGGADAPITATFDGDVTATGSITPDVPP